MVLSADGFWKTEASERSTQSPALSPAEASSARRWSKLPQFASASHAALHAATDLR